MVNYKKVIFEHPLAIRGEYYHTDVKIILNLFGGGRLGAYPTQHHLSISPASKQLRSLSKERKKKKKS